jgi:hypothetical protein
MPRSSVSVSSRTAELPRRCSPAPIRRYPSPIRSPRAVASNSRLARHVDAPLVDAEGQRRDVARSRLSRRCVKLVHLPRGTRLPTARSTHAGGASSLVRPVRGIVLLVAVRRSLRCASLDRSDRAARANDAEPLGSPAPVHPVGERRPMANVCGPGLRRSRAHRKKAARRVAHVCGVGSWSEAHRQIGHLGRMIREARCRASHHSRFHASPDRRGVPVPATSPVSVSRETSWRRTSHPCVPKLARTELPSGFRGIDDPPWERPTSGSGVRRSASSPDTPLRITRPEDCPPFSRRTPDRRHLTRSATVRATHPIGHPILSVAATPTARPPGWAPKWPRTDRLALDHLRDMRRVASKRCWVGATGSSRPAAPRRRAPPRR